MPPNRKKDNKPKGLIKYVKPPGISHPMKNNTLKKVWHGFRILGDYFVLTGHYSQYHKKFRMRSRGLQGASNCVVACLFAINMPMPNWTTKTLDYILDIGDALYYKSVQNTYKKEIKVKDVASTFFVGEYKYSMCITLWSGKTEDCYLREELEKFLQLHDYGIVSMGGRFIAIWKKDAYYFFDPTEYDEEGEPWRDLPQWGFCCCLRFKLLERFLDKFLEIAPCKTKFTIHICTLERMKKIELCPPECYRCLCFIKEICDREKPPVRDWCTPLQQDIPVDKIAPITIGKPREICPPPKTEAKAGKTDPMATAKAKGYLPCWDLSRFLQSTKKIKEMLNIDTPIAALVMLREKKTKHWSTHTLNSIIRIGESFHANPQDLPQIADKKFKPVLEEYVTIGRLQSSDPKILDLQPALTEFFTTNETCIVIGPLITAVWIEEACYYLFEAGTIVQNFAILAPFQNLDELSKYYLKFVPQSQKRDEFFLTKVIVEDFQQLPCWCNFKGISNVKWILRGSFSQASRRFARQSRNNQSACNAIMSLVFAKIINTKDWDIKTIDTVLEKGQELYQLSITNLLENDTFASRDLSLDEVSKSFLNNNKKVNMELECIFEGDNLNKGLKLFFENNERGILLIRNTLTAFWKDEGYFYFDPQSRDDHGLITDFGMACCVRVLNQEDLFQTPLSNLPARSSNSLKLYRVDFEFIDVTTEGTIQPPLNNFSDLGNNIAILRSDTHEYDEKYGENKGLQSTPMCVLALAMSDLVPAIGWNKKLLGRVLDLGDELYNDSLLLFDTDDYSIDEEDETEEEEISTARIKKDFKIGLNQFEVRFTTCFEGNLEDGLCEQFSELLESENVEDQMFIIEGENFTTSVWKQNEVFYLFDPRDRNSRGCGPAIQEEPYFGVGEEQEREEFDHMDQDEESSEEGKVRKGGEEGEGEEDEKGDNDEVEGEVEVDELLDKKAWELPYLKDVLGEEEEMRVYYFDGPGKACILRFCKIDDILEHLLKNIPKKAYVKLSRTEMTNTPILKVTGEDWGGFKQVDENLWILRGTKNLCDEFFPITNRGKQQIPNCFACLSFVRLYDLEKFTPQTVDDILTYGDRLYTFVVNKIPDKDSFGILEFGRKFCIGDFMVELTVKVEEKVGDVSAKDEDDVLSVFKGLQEFFSGSVWNLGILSAKDRYVAIWRDGSFYCMFDSCPRGPNGEPSAIGVACITRFSQLDDLARLFTKTLSREGNNRFTIHGIDVTKCKCPKRPIYVTPLGGFNEVAPQTHIIRCSKNMEERSRNKHSALCVIALAMTLLQKSNTWTKLTLDEIDKWGMELYYDSAQIIGVDCVDVYSLKKDFFVRNLRVCIEFRPQEICGMKKLRRGLNEYFELYNRGLLIADDMIFAIWIDGNECGGSEEVFIYDPNPRDENGQPTCIGRRCVIKVPTTKIAANHILGLLKDQCICDFKNYLLIPIDYVIAEDKCKRKKKKKHRGEILKHGWRQISRHLQVLTGSKCSLPNRDITTVLAAYVVSKSTAFEHWRRCHIDLALDIGNQLYIDSKLAYNPTNPKLGLENILRKFFVKEIEATIKIYRPVCCGQFNRETFYEMLERIFNKEEFCMFIYKNDYFGLFKRGICYYVFCPYGGKLEKYGDLMVLVSKLVDNYCCAEVECFYLLLVDVVF